MVAFFERLSDDVFRSTTATRGPWSVDHQHAGPPSALLGGLLEQALGAGRVVRITFEILRPVLITDLTAHVEVIRPGGRVALAQGHLADEDGPVLLARAWRIRTTDARVEADAPDADAPLPPRPHEGREGGFFDVPWDEGYHRSVETWFTTGSFDAFGDAFAWFRLLVPVVADQEPTPLERVLVAADSGNGISARFHPHEVLFVNTELSVHLREHPVDEWVGIDAATRFAGDGIGLATTTVHGSQGPIGRGAQSLLVERR